MGFMPDIVVDGRALPGGLRDLFGMPAPQPEVPSVSGLEPLTPAPDVASVAPGLPSMPQAAVLPAASSAPQEYVAPTPAAIAPPPKAARGSKAAAPAQPKMPTLGGAVDEQQLAYQDAAHANVAATDVAVRQANDIAQVNERADADLRASMDQQKAFQEQSDKTRADKQAFVDATQKEVDHFKIDPNKYWHDAGTGKKIGWVIAMALSGLGDALQHKSGPNPVIGMFEAAIDRDIKMQEDRRTQLKEKLGRAEGAVDKWDRFSQNQDARFLAQRAQAKELVAQQLATAASKYGSEAAVANGMKAAADLRKSAADDSIKAVDMAHGHAMQEGQLRVSQASAATAAGHLALAREQFKSDKEYKDAQLALEAGKQMQARQEAVAKQDRELGIGGNVVEKEVDGETIDPATGAKRPGKVKVFESKPLQQRDGSVYHAANTEAQQKIIAARTNVQGMHDVLGELIKLRERAGGANKFTSPGDQADYEQIVNRAVVYFAAANHLSLADKQSTDYARDALLGGDPSGYNVGDVIGRINRALSTETRNYHTFLKSNGYDGPPPKFDAAPAEAKETAGEASAKAVVQGKAPLEQAAGEEPGAVRKVGERIFNPVGQQPWERRAEEAASGGSLKIPGLSDDQAGEVGKLLKTAAKAAPGSKASDDARVALVKLASEPDRPAIRNAVLVQLENDFPDLYDAAVAKMPDVDERIFWEGRAASRRHWAGKR